MNCSFRLFVTLGPGDVVSARRQASAGEAVHSTSIAYSEQLVAYCKARRYPTLAISANPRSDVLVDGLVILENRPKPLHGAAGIAFHISQLLYAVYLCWRAVRFRANIAVIDSGTTHYFCLWLFRLFGISVVPNLHNTLWPRGYRPTGTASRLLLGLDALFFAYGASVALGVSPECERQVAMQARGRVLFFQYRCQFRDEGFTHAQPYRGGPFRLCFAGRAERNKGLLDLATIGRALTQRSPVPITMEVCGDGPSLSEFKKIISEQGLADTIRACGRLGRSELLSVYARSHAIVVPTRGDFCEGVPAVCAEAMLARLPVVASDATNSLDVIGPASLQVPTNDVEGFIQAILRLVNSPETHGALQAGCARAADQFTDRSFSMPAAIDRALNALTGQSTLASYSALFRQH
ncbi:glycosyltransferase family 4 protein [Bradyrhizobium guangdongense]